MTTDTDIPTPEQLAEVLDRGPNAVPVTIYMLNGKRFIVSGVGAWKYEEEGVFATGHFDGEHRELDLLIPYPRIDYYSLDFKALQRWIEANKPEAGDASPGT